MHIYLVKDGQKTPLKNMSWAQTKQAAAIMDCFGRLIPQEGIDYDVEIDFKGEYDPSVSLNVTSQTDKGEWWKKYVAEMIKKYPPMVENPEEAIKEDNTEDVYEQHDAEDDGNREPPAVTPDDIISPQRNVRPEREVEDAQIVS